MANQLGNLKNMKIEIDSPMELNFDLDYNSLVILIGKNGSGKSLILRLTWVLQYIAQNYLYSVKFGKNIPIIDFAQTVFDQSFENQNFNGEISVIFDNEDSLSIFVNKGKITNVLEIFDKETEPSGLPIYMSTNTRLYSDMNKYLILRKLHGVTGVLSPQNEAGMMELLKSYRLYDLLFIEGLITDLLNMPNILSKSLKVRLKNEFEIKEPIVSIGIDLNTPEFYYVDDKGERKSMSTLSNGEQALINMMTSAGRNAN